MPQYEFDKFGYCVLCSEQVVVKEFIDGREQWRALPNHAEEEVLLSDGSKMRICLCDQCKPLVPDNLDLIMTKVYKGWEHSIVEAQWSEEKKQAYLSRYSQLSIQGVA